MSAMGTKPCRSVAGIDPADCGHRIVAGADYFWDGDRAYCSPACVERAKREEAMETSDVPFLLAGLDVDSIKTLHGLVERGRQAETADTILRWAEAGFPPWGCHSCRGGEYGPDGVACPACGGDSTSMEPPERAKALLALLVSNGLGHEPRR